MSSENFFRRKFLFRINYKEHNDTRSVVRLCFLLLSSPTKPHTRDAYTYFLGTREKLPVVSESVLPVTEKEGKGDGEMKHRSSNKGVRKFITYIKWMLFMILLVDKQFNFSWCTFFYLKYFGTLGSTSKGLKPEPYPIKMESRNRLASGTAHSRFPLHNNMWWQYWTDILQRKNNVGVLK